MGFFSRKNSLPGQVAISSNEAISSILSKDMRLTGEIAFKGKARIDGTVDGNIRGEHLVLSESGKVSGDLELVSLVCHGTVEGNIKAQQVTMLSSAFLKGNLAAASLTVEPGARLNGEITSSSQQPTKSSTESPSARAAPAKQNQEKG